MTNPILADLAPLFERADKERLWFYCGYQQLWFSPAELRAEHANGKFIWGAVNWRLRDPQEMIDSAIKDVNTAQATLSRLQQKLAMAQ